MFGRDSLVNILLKDAALQRSADGRNTMPAQRFELLLGRNTAAIFFHGRHLTGALAYRHGWLASNRLIALAQRAITALPRVRVSRLPPTTTVTSPRRL
jgi:hypothetical protein